MSTQYINIYSMLTFLHTEHLLATIKMREKYN